MLKIVYIDFWGGLGVVKVDKRLLAFYFLGKRYRCVLVTLSFCSVLCDSCCSIPRMFCRAVVSLQLSDQWGTVSYCLIAWLSAVFSPWMEEKKEGRKRGRTKEVERRKIFPRRLGFSWPRILWVKFKAWSTCLALFKFAKATYFSEFLYHKSDHLLDETSSGLLRDR